MKNFVAPASQRDRLNRRRHATLASLFYLMGLHTASTSRASINTFSGASFRKIPLQVDQAFPKSSLLNTRQYHSNCLPLSSKRKQETTTMDNESMVIIVQLCLPYSSVARFPLANEILARLPNVRDHRADKISGWSEHKATVTIARRFVYTCKLFALWPMADAARYTNFHLRSTERVMPRVWRAGVTLLTRTTSPVFVRVACESLEKIETGEDRRSLGNH